MRRHEPPLSSLSFRSTLLYLILSLLLCVALGPLIFLVALVIGLAFVGVRDFIRPRRAIVRRRAGLLLASLGDTRAIAPLADAWQPNPATAEAQAENEQIETYLSSLIAQVTSNQATANAELADALMRLLRRAARDWRRTAQQAREGIELTDARADMLIAALCFMARTRNTRYHALLREFAALPIPETAPNRQIVREAAVEGIAYRAARKGRAGESGTATVRAGKTT
jgi:hypothetical protein